MEGGTRWTGTRVPLLLWHASRLRQCDWPAPRRVSSARRSDRGQRNSPGPNAQPEETSTSTGFPDSFPERHSSVIAPAGHTTVTSVQGI